MIVLEKKTYKLPDFIDPDGDEIQMSVKLGSITIFTEYKDMQFNF